MSNGFFFSPKKWTSDVNILRMDWDAKAMHMQLLCYAFQQDPQGYLLDDEIIVRKLLENPSDEVWNRVKPQIYNCWKSKNVIVDGVKQKYLYNLDLMKQIKEIQDLNLDETQKSKTKVKVVKKKKDEKGVEFDDMPFEGFDLRALTKLKPAVTILYEAGTEETKTTIWDLGVQLFEKHGIANTQARGILAKLRSEFGEEALSNAIAAATITTKPIIEINSYLRGILKDQHQKSKMKKRGNSFVI